MNEKATMTAKQMFEAIGFKEWKDSLSSSRTAYEKLYDDERQDRIVFDESTKTYYDYFFDEWGERGVLSKTPQLHQAITKKLEELRWL